MAADADQPRVAISGHGTSAHRASEPIARSGGLFAVIAG